MGLLLRTTCVTVISFLWLKKHTTHFKLINHWPQETVCYFPPPSSYGRLLPWRRTDCSHLFEPFLAAISFWQKPISTINSTDQHTCPPPGFPLRCFRWVRFISCTWHSEWEAMDGDVITVFFHIIHVKRLILWEEFKSVQCLSGEYFTGLDS